VADYTVPAGIDVSEAQTRRGGEIEQWEMTSLLELVAPLHPSKPLDAP
jgi:hypothetical protein